MLPLRIYVALSEWSRSYRDTNRSPDSQGRRPRSFGFGEVRRAYAPFEDSLGRTGVAGLIEEEE
jgi:hypothetical protein